MFPHRKLKPAETSTSRMFGRNDNFQGAVNDTLRLTDIPSSCSTSLSNMSPSSSYTGTRTIACKPSPMAAHSSSSRINLSSSEGILHSQGSMIGTMYHIQPNSGFANRWQNQQMTFGVLPVQGQNISTTNIQQSDAVQMIRSEKVLGSIENQMFQSDQIFQHAPSSSVQNKRKFQFDLASESTGGDKENKKKQVADTPFDNRHLIGSVDQVIRWHQITKSSNVFPIYEVHGILESKNVKSEDTVILMLKQAGYRGACLQGIFYAIDRPFPNYLQPGDEIVCVGKMKGAKKMQVFNAWRENEKYEDYSRVFYLSNQALQPFLLSPPEP